MGKGTKVILAVALVLIVAVLPFVFLREKARPLTDICPAVTTGNYHGRILWDELQEGAGDDRYAAAISDEEFRTIFGETQVKKGEKTNQTPSPAFEIRLTAEGVGYSIVVGQDATISIGETDNLENRTFWKDCDGQIFSRLYACHLKNGGVEAEGA